MASVVRIRGELDLAGLALVEAEVDRVAATETRKIVLDLEQLEFIDCAGVRLLIELERRSKDDGGRLRLTAAAPSVRRVLELTGADRLLPWE